MSLTLWEHHVVFSCETYYWFRALNISCHFSVTWIRNGCSSHVGNKQDTTGTFRTILNGGILKPLECQIGIFDWQISASSEWDWISDAINHLVATPGIHQGVWSSAILNANQWLQVDLGIHSSSTITRVATQGRDDIVLGSWVTKYKLQYSDYGINFQYYRELQQTTAKVYWIKL